MAETESRRHRLSCFVGHETADHPAVSAGGKRVAFVWRGRLYVSDIRGEPYPVVQEDLRLGTGTAYGGKCFCFLDDNRICFTARGRPYLLELASSPPRCSKVLEKVPGRLYAPSYGGGTLVFCAESEEGIGLVRTSNVMDPPSLWQWQRLAVESDMAYDPVVLRGGAVAFVGFSHPHMLWDRSALYVAWDDAPPALVEAHGLLDRCVLQPRVSPSGAYVSYLHDQFDTFRIALWTVAEPDSRSGEASCRRVVYLIWEGPTVAHLSLWNTGQSSYTWLSEYEVGASFLYVGAHDDGTFGLYRVELEWEAPGGAAKATRLALSWAEEEVTDGLPPFCLDQCVFHTVSSAAGCVTAVASGPTYPAGIIFFCLEGATGKVRLLDTALASLGPCDLAVPCSGPPPATLRNRAVSAPRGGATGRTSVPAVAMHWEDGPTSRPFLVLLHGGPTGVFTVRFHPLVSFLLDAGFVVIGVNYRGSLNCGRAYRQSLCGTWGEADVEDALAVVRHLRDHGVDGIRPSAVHVGGSSAGGFTALLCARFPAEIDSILAICAVADLQGFASQTHLLERYYNHSLLSGDDEERARLEVTRSPLFCVRGPTAPVLLLHGQDDLVVPPSQAVAMHNTLGDTATLHLYPGGHSFIYNPNVLSNALPRIEEFFLLNSKR